MPAPERTTDSEPGEFSLISIANVLLRERFIVGVCTLLVFFVTVALQLTKPRLYTSESAFAPLAMRSQGGLSGIAAQFGVSLGGGGDGSQSPAFYIDLVRSREILGPVAEARYSYVTAKRRVVGTLADVYGIDGDSMSRRHAAVENLATAITPTLNGKTGVIHLKIRAPDPSLAQAINARVLEELNRFNLQNRQSQAASERRFTEQRLAEASAALQEAEARLEDFLLRNREYRDSPRLTFDYGRLAREVSHRQQIYTSVAQAYEQARVAEIRDTPVLTIVERPDTPIGPDRRGLLRKGAVALLLGGFVGVLIAFGRQFVRNVRDDESAELAEFRRLGSDTWYDLRHPLRALARRAWSRDV